LKKNYEIEINWTAFPLHPDTPEEGLTLEELFAGRSIDIDQIKTRLKQVADEEGLPLGERKKTYNSRLAQELGKWAESQGRGDEFHMALFRAYFVDGKNIGKIPILIDLAESMELSRKGAQEALETRAFKEAVDLDWSRSREKGVTAVPTFMLNQQAVVGAQPYEVLEQFMKSNNVRKRNPGP
jgi:predicted DsbA family dithiol-disulfide isomerase